MPDYDITSPDGKKYTVTAPQGATQEQILSYAQRHHAENAAPANTDPQPNGFMRGAGERMLGVGELANNVGLGKHIGLPSNEILEGAKNIAEEQGKGTGIKGTLEEMAGDPLTYAGGAMFKGATTIPKLAMAGARAGAAEGLTQGGKTEKENVNNALKGLGAGVALTAGLPAIAGKAVQGAKTLVEGYKAGSPEFWRGVANDVRRESNGHYKAMRDANSYISSNASINMQKEVGKKLADTGLFNDELHKQTLSVLKGMQKDMAKGIGVEKLDQYRQLLSDVVRRNTDIKGQINGDAFKAKKAIESIDEIVDNLKPSDLTNQSKATIDSLKSARATWAKSRKIETITEIMEKSNGDPNRMKALLEQLYNNKKRIAGFTAEEKKALKDAASNTTGEGLLKMAGKFGITLGHGRAAATGNVIPAVEMLVGGMKKGLPIVAGATGAKYAQKLAGQAKTERLLKLIHQGGKPALPSSSTQQILQKAVNPIMILPNP